MKSLIENINLNEFEVVKKRPRLVVLFDFDDVLNNNLETLISLWNKRTGNNKTINDCLHWDLTVDFDKDIVKYFKEKYFFRNLDAKEHAVETINKLINDDRFEVYIVSSCGSIQEYSEKYEWIQEKISNFKMSKFISCSEKDVIRGDVIIDDKAETLVKCSPYMEVVAMDKPHNRALDCLRIKDISEIIPIVENLYRRKYGK